MRRFLIITIILLGISSFSAFAEGEREIQPVVTETGITVMDSYDRSVTIGKAAARVVSLASSVTETIFALGMGDILMGRTPFLGRFDRESGEDIEIAEWAMQETGVLKFREKLITHLSGGELQRVVIARALTQEPAILALDEPTSHLDIHHQINILSIIRSLAKRKNLTILAVLHDVNHALEYCDNLFLLDQGKIVNSGSPEKVITPGVMKDVYNLNVEIKKNPFTGNLYMVHDYT